MAISLTMRRSIVALSFLCFFSSAFRFLFSRLAATRYSRARCFLSHSAPAHPCQYIVQCCLIIFPTMARRRLVNARNILVPFSLFLHCGRLVNARNILVPFSLFLHRDRLSVRWLTEPGGVGPSRRPRIEQHGGQVNEDSVQETYQWS